MAESTFTREDAEGVIDQTLYTEYRRRLAAETTAALLRKSIDSIVVYWMASKICHKINEARVKFKLTKSPDEEFQIPPISGEAVADYDELVAFASEHSSDWDVTIIPFIAEHPELSDGVLKWVDTTDDAGNSRCGLLREAMWEDVVTLLRIIENNPDVNRAGAELIPVLVLGKLVSEFGNTMMHGEFLGHADNRAYQTLLSAIGIARSVYPISKIVAVGGSQRASMLLGFGANFERSHTFTVCRTLQTIISSAGTTMPMITKFFDNLTKNGMGALMGFAGGSGQGD